MTAPAASFAKKDRQNKLNQAKPKHVAILGLGPSLECYVDVTKRMGDRRKFCDETWGINAAANVLQCDLAFHMDDVRVQEIRAKAKPESNIAAMVKWLKGHTGPVLTSRAHPDYPCLIDYPLADVMNACGGVAYFNSTAAYAVAYAIYKKVEKITLFGCDFSFPNSHDAEKGRGCVEFYLGMAKARGIAIGLPDRTSLMDGIATRDQRIYGYDTLDIEFVHGDDGKISTVFKPRDKLPTAEEIEARYDHSQPTVPAALREKAA